ncbi:hypothetical protein [Actinoplanes sp. NPDC051851]|uniref:hypothetical protein n=1 Tax=Actinoplanes sp. NPDC051851 TaxID=3154753 RepID=UPI00341CEE5B
MTSPVPGQPEPIERTEADVRRGRVDRRRERIRQDVRNAKSGNHKIPTWLMASILGLFLAGWIYLIVTS